MVGVGFGGGGIVGCDVGGGGGGVECVVVVGWLVGWDIGDLWLDDFVLFGFGLVLGFFVLAVCFVVEWLFGCAIGGLWLDDFVVGFFEFVVCLVVCDLAGGSVLLGCFFAALLEAFFFDWT